MPVRNQAQEFLDALVSFRQGIRIWEDIERTAEEGVGGFDVGWCRSHLQADFLKGRQRTRHVDARRDQQARAPASRRIDSSGVNGVLSGVPAFSFKDER